MRCTGTWPAGLIAGLARLGVEAAVARHDGPAGPVCFAGQQGADLRVGDRKLCGSAQVRRAGAVLQHGSMLLERLPFDETDLPRRAPRDARGDVGAAAGRHRHAGGARGADRGRTRWLDALVEGFAASPRPHFDLTVQTSGRAASSEGDVRTSRPHPGGVPFGHAMPPVRPPERVRGQLLLLVRQPAAPRGRSDAEPHRARRAARARRGARRGPGRAARGHGHAGGAPGPQRRAAATSSTPRSPPSAATPTPTSSSTTSPCRVATPPSDASTAATRSPTSGRSTAPTSTTSGSTPRRCTTSPTCRSAGSCSCSWSGAASSSSTREPEHLSIGEVLAELQRRVPRHHDLEDPLPREPGTGEPGAHAVGLPEVLRARPRAAALDPLPAEGALPPAEGDQGAPRRAAAGRARRASSTRRRPPTRPAASGRGRSRAPAVVVDHRRRRGQRTDRAAPAPAPAGVRTHPARRRRASPTTTSLGARRRRGARTTRAELAAAAGLVDAQLSELESYGLVAPSREVDGDRPVRRRRARGRPHRRRLLPPRRRGPPPPHVPHLRRAGGGAVRAGADAVRPPAQSRGPGAACRRSWSSWRRSGAACAPRCCATRCARPSPSERPRPSVRDRPVRRRCSTRPRSGRASSAWRRRSRPITPTASCSSACSRAR